MAVSLAQKVLNYLGLRVMFTWIADELKALWGTIETETAQSIYNSTVAVNVGMEENQLALSPYLAPRESGSLPYSNQPEYEFTEGTTLTLGAVKYLVTEGANAGQIIDEPGADSDLPFAIPSLIQDSEGNDHTVFPVWQHTGGKWQFAPKNIVYSPNTMYLGGWLDGHIWRNIFTCSETRSGATMVFSGCTEGYAEVTMFARLVIGDGEYLYGYVTAVNADEVTVAVIGGEGGETVTALDVYWEAAV